MPTTSKVDDLLPAPSAKQQHASGRLYGAARGLAGGTVLRMVMLVTREWPGWDVSAIFRKPNAS